MKYTTWTALVFEALARTGDGSYGGVGLPAVAATLGFDGVTWNDFAKHEGMPNALMTAMDDLAWLGLVTSENIGWGNELTPRGRDVADAGLASIWPELAKIHVPAQEASFLSKLYEASAVEEERWADLLLVDVDEVAGLSGVGRGDSAGLIRRVTFLGDLERKGLLEAGPRFGGGPLLDRPTYIAAVLLTADVEASPARVSVSSDAVVSAPLDSVDGHQLPGSSDLAETMPEGEQKHLPEPGPGRSKGPAYILTRADIEGPYRDLWAQHGHRPSWNEVAGALRLDERTLRRARGRLGMNERPITQTPE